MIGVGFSTTQLATRARPEGSLPSVYNLDFTSGSLPPQVTLSRASTASYVMASGDITTVAAHTARFDHDPITATPLGLLIEGTSQNVLTNSLSVLGSGWGEGATTSTNLSLSALGIFPGVEVLSNGAGWARLLHSAQPTVTNGTTYGFSLWYRAGTSGRIRCILRSNTGSETRFAGLIGSPKGISATNAGALTIISDDVQADGVTRKLTAEITTSFDGTLSVGIGPDTTSPTGSVILLAAQLVTIPIGSYIATSGSIVTRAADVVGLTSIAGNFDITATYGDDATEAFTSQTVGEGYWPSLSETHVKSLVLTRL